MTFADLDSHELVVYLALAKIVIRADGKFSPEEGRALEERVGRQVGAKAFTDALAKVPGFGSASTVRDAAVALERDEVKAFLFEELKLIAESDDLTEKEEQLLAGIGRALGVG